MRNLKVKNLSNSGSYSFRKCCWTQAVLLQINCYYHRHHHHHHRQWQQQQRRPQQWQYHYYNKSSYPVYSEYNDFLVHHIRESLDNQVVSEFASQFFDSLFPLNGLFLVWEVLLAHEAQTVVPLMPLNILNIVIIKTFHVMFAICCFFFPGFFSIDTFLVLQSLQEKEREGS